MTLNEHCSDSSRKLEEWSVQPLIAKPTVCSVCGGYVGVCVEVPHRTSSKAKPRDSERHGLLFSLPPGSG